MSMIYDCENIDTDCKIISWRHTSRALHYHNCIEMVYVAQGSSTHYIKFSNGDEKTWMLSKGDYFILDYGTQHSYINGTADFTIINFLFRPELIEKISKQEPSLQAILCAPPFYFSRGSLTASLSEMVFRDHDNMIFDIFKKALLIYQTQKYGYRELLRGYVIETILLTTHPLLQNVPNDAKSQIITQIQDYIAIHYAEHITLTNICRELFYSLQYISKRFKEVSGVSFERYLQETRIRNACGLLMETSYSIDDIAYMVGYSDPSSFRKVFHKFTGRMPSSYRKKNGQRGGTADQA